MAADENRTMQGADAGRDPAVRHHHTVSAAAPAAPAAKKAAATATATIKKQTQPFAIPPPKHFIITGNGS